MPSPIATTPCGSTPTKGRERDDADPVAGRAWGEKLRRAHVFEPPRSVK
jgi:hypothetical protein